MITNERAREIASHWSSLGHHGIGMTQFASTGTVTEALLDDIERETGKASGSDLAELVSLDDFINTLAVPVWTVGFNQPGYLPDSPESVSWHLDYADALAAFEDSLNNAHEGWFGDVECECTDGELCDGCGTEALIRSFCRDEMPSVVGGKVFGEPCTANLSLRPEHLAVPTEFWLDRVETSVAAYRAQACS